MGRQRRREDDAVEYAISTGTVRKEQVPGEPDSWILYVNGVPSSAVTIGDPLRLDFEYLDWMSRIISSRFSQTEPVRAVHIGAAACSLPRWLAAAYPHARQTAVDIDAQLVRYVREWFDLPRAPRLALRVGDGAEEISTFRPGSVDVLVRDAFAGDAVPTQLAGDDFAAAGARALSERGLALFNIADKAPHHLLSGEVTVLRRHFAHLALAADPGQIRGRRWGNVIAIAAHEPLDLVRITQALRRGPAVASVLHGAQLDRYAGIGGQQN